MNPEAPSFRPSGSHDHTYHGELPLGPLDHGLPLTSNDPRSQVPCRYFLQGKCLKGDYCPFLHDNTTESQASAPASPKAIESPTQHEFTRFIKGGLIYFEAGAAVKKVSLASDFSIIHISDLPSGSSKESVLDLLHSYGFDLPSETEAWVNQSTVCPQQAHVKVEDPEFAELACQKIPPPTASRHYEGKQPTAFVGRHVPMRPHLDTSFDVVCKEVHVSWPKPSRTVRLNFDDEYMARRVTLWYQSGDYRVLNEKVQASKMARGTVHLTEVPAHATESDISKSIYHKARQPQSIELGKPTYSSDEETCSATIQSLFTSIGPLEWWEFTPDTAGKRMKASGRFRNEYHAIQAARTLNQSDLPFHDTAKLTVKLNHMAEIMVAENIYRAIKPQLKKLTTTWEASNLHFTACDNPGNRYWDRMVKIEGEVAKEVVKAKNTITNLKSGMLAKQGSSVLWHPELHQEGTLFRQLKLVGRQTGVTIIRNKPKSRIQLYGSPIKCKSAQAEIANLLSENQIERFNIDLDARQFNWVLRGGLALLEKETGPGKVRFDITSTPKRVVIVGTIKDHDTANRLLGNKGATKTRRDEPTKKDCCVCWMEAENPIETRCGHIYCLDCFENLCVSSTRKDKPTLIRCVGEADGCSKVFSLSELEDHLPTSAFEELLEQSFHSYVRLHPNSLKYCPSIDCGYFYRINSNPKIQTCEQCLTPVCTACLCQHGTMTCADYKDISTGRYAAFEKFKEENGIKDCPKCKTPLEKVDGCNHVACPCGAHICWVCFRTFEEKDPCYFHMNQAHDGIGLDDLNARFGFY